MANKRDLTITERIWYWLMKQSVITLAIMLVLVICVPLAFLSWKLAAVVALIITITGTCVVIIQAIIEKLI